MSGAKLCTEAMALYVFTGVVLTEGKSNVRESKLKLRGSSEHIRGVGELTVVGRSMIVRTCGRNSSENAGMSSESKVRIFTVESLRFPGEGSSAQGKSGPKLRPRGVGDGQQVEIPVLPLIVIREVGTQGDKLSE